MNIEEKAPSDWSDCRCAKTLPTCKCKCGLDSKGILELILIIGLFKGAKRQGELSNQSILSEVNSPFGGRILTKVNKSVIRGFAFIYEVT